jgi:hypothetical protein
MSGAAGIPGLQAGEDVNHVQFVLLSCAWWLNDHGVVSNQLRLARQAGTDVKMASQVTALLRRLAR